MVAAGGMFGALARYVMSGWITRINGTSFPYGTFAVNILGSLLLGFLGTLLLEKLSLSRVDLDIGSLLHSSAHFFRKFTQIRYRSLARTPLCAVGLYQCPIGMFFTIFPAIAWSYKHALIIAPKLCIIKGLSLHYMGFFKDSRRYFRS